MTDNAVLEKEPLHFANSLGMNTFVVGKPGGRFLEDRRQSFVQGFFTTPQQARILEASIQELAESKLRSGATTDSEVKKLHAWELYARAQSDVFADRSDAAATAGVAAGFDDTIRVANDWVLRGCLDIDENGRFVPGQVLTPEKLVLSGAKHWPARPQSW